MDRSVCTTVNPDGAEFNFSSFEPSFSCRPAPKLTCFLIGRPGFPNTVQIFLAEPFLFLGFLWGKALGLGFACQLVDSLDSFWCHRGKTSLSLDSRKQLFNQHRACFNIITRLLCGFLTEAGNTAALLSSAVVN